MSLLRVQNLCKSFTSGFWPFNVKRYDAVNNISFELKKGEILGFLGTNGAGKTTTIQMLLGTLTPTSGAISYFDKDFEKNRIAILKRVSSASGYDKLPARLSIWQNLDIVGRMYNLTTAQREENIEHLLKQFNMIDMRNKETGMLSAGQSTKVMLAKAFLSNPEIVLLDEPTAALDPESAQEVREFVLQQKQKGVSMLFTSHNMNEVTQVCDRVLILKKGEIIANNTPEQLAGSVSLARVHLFVTEGLEKLRAHVSEHAIKHTLEEHSIHIEVDEHHIADFLMMLAENKIRYSQISIDKPTLEDYFLTIARR